MQSDKKKQDDRVFVMAVIKAYSKDGQNILITVRNDHVLFYGSSNILFFGSLNMTNASFFFLIGQVSS